MASSSADSEKSVNVEEKAGFDSFDIVKCNGIPYVPFTQSGDNPGLQPAEPGTAGAQQFPDILLYVR